MARHPDRSCLEVAVALLLMVAAAAVGVSVVEVDPQPSRRPVEVELVAAGSLDWIVLAALQEVGARRLTGTRLQPRSE